MNTFAEALRAYRQRVPGPPTRGNRFDAQHSWLSQNQLAKRAGVDVSYLSRLERSLQPPPSRAVVVAIANGLGLDAPDRLALLRAAGHTPSEPMLQRGSQDRESDD